MTACKASTLSATNSQGPPPGHSPAGSGMPAACPAASPGYLGPESWLLLSAHITLQFRVSDARVFSTPRLPNTHGVLYRLKFLAIYCCQKSCQTMGVTGPGVPYICRGSCRSSGTTGWRAPWLSRWPGCSAPPSPSPPSAPRLRFGGQRCPMVTRAYFAVLKALQRLRWRPTAASSVPQQHHACQHGGGRTLAAKMTPGGGGLPLPQRLFDQLPSATVARIICRVFSNAHLVGVLT